jgi:FdhE protein
VAGGFLHRLFGASRSPPEVEAALAELARLAQERPLWSDSVAVLQDFLPALFCEPVRDNPPALTPEQAAGQLAGGIPLLRGESFQPDAKSFRRRWQRVCAALERRQGNEAAQELTQAAGNGSLDPLELAQQVLAGTPQGVHARADELGLDAGLTATVLRLTLFPVLARVEEVLRPLREGSRWEQGFCPTCGSWPLLGEFRGLEQVRFLRCGLCAGEWEFARLCCPFCGTRDHQLLGYFHVEGEEARLRAATCESCRGYVKMVTTLSALSALELLVKELATMHLDLAAAERGYGPPP